MPVQGVQGAWTFLRSMLSSIASKSFLGKSLALDNYPKALDQPEKIKQQRLVLVLTNTANFKICVYCVLNK